MSKLASIGWAIRRFCPSLSGPSGSRALEEAVPHVRTKRKGSKRPPSPAVRQDPGRAQSDFSNHKETGNAQCQNPGRHDHVCRCGAVAMVGAFRQQGCVAERPAQGMPANVKTFNAKVLGLIAMKQPITHKTRCRTQPTLRCGVASTTGFSMIHCEANTTDHVAKRNGVGTLTSRSTIRIETLGPRCVYSIGCGCVAHHPH